ncbi:hypothetical protein ADK43_38140 [Streptomyces rimosus subsp. rimosus]|nr:hypothetical protein ADK43_38140 [Streptomyces rimosus subsp. rimosus]
MIGRVEEARILFEKLLSLRNDLGLLAEEWDSRLQRQVGNFPQAFTHVALVDAALRLSALLPTPAATAPQAHHASQPALQPAPDRAPSASDDRDGPVIPAARGAADVHAIPSESTV